MPALTWNNKNLAITAKVDAVINVTDLLEWTHSFMPDLIPDSWAGDYDLTFDGADPHADSGDQHLSSGRWDFTVTSGTCDETHPIELLLDPEQPGQSLLATLTALNTPVAIIVPPEVNNWVIRLVQGTLAPATVLMKNTGYFTHNGDPPSVVTHGDTLTAQFPYTPRPGALTATAHVYEGNGLLIASSDEITLTITGSDGGGSQS